MLLAILLVLVNLIHSGALAQESGFSELFDGETFSGWRGRPHFDPRQERELDDKAAAEKQAAWNADRDQHWRIEDHLIISDGHGVFLTTERDYGDFELRLDWKMMSPGGDSGIYLRGSPQIQIWDPANERERKNGAFKGSGALWNNNADNPGKWPLVLADKPIGEWNSMRIRMIGSRVWVWLNDQQTVNGSVLDNYWDRSLPMFAEGPIQLQTHGSEMRFRNIQIREIGVEESNKILAGFQSDGFQSIFDGESFSGWTGATSENEIRDKCILTKSGVVYTEKEWNDFAVQFQFKLPPAGNNGLAIRYSGEGNPAFDGMCELQILDSEHPNYATLKPYQYHGSAYGMVPAHRGYLRPTGEWNFQRVSVQGSQINVELNGTVILDCDLSEITDPDQAHPGKDRTSGHFGFFGHGDPVLFRNIQAKAL